MEGTVGGYIDNANDGQVGCGKFSTIEFDTTNPRAHHVGRKTGPAMNTGYQALHNFIKGRISRWGEGTEERVIEVDI